MGSRGIQLFLHSMDLHYFHSTSEHHRPTSPKYFATETDGREQERDGDQPATPPSPAPVGARHSSNLGADPSCRQPARPPP